MTTIRTLLLLLALAAAFPLSASEPIPAPTIGNSNSVTQPHVVAELIPDYTAIAEGKPFLVALHLHSDPKWHTYWINPGDSGLATTLKWTLPPGFTAGPIQWPTPEIHAAASLVAYGYEGDVYLLTTITPPAERDKWPLDVEIKAKSTWLVCDEECIPGKAEMSFRLEAGLTKEGRAQEALRAKFFEEAQGRLPVPNTEWRVEASYVRSPGDDGQVRDVLQLHFPQSGLIPLTETIFLPEQANVLSTTAPAAVKLLTLRGLEMYLPLQQNGEKPDNMSGVIIFKNPPIDGPKSIYLPEFPVASEGAPAVPGGGSQTVTPSTSASTPVKTALTPEPLLLGVLAAAFIGGLILNLMPCVLPVLSLKVFSLMKHAGDDPRGAWKQGAAFTAGVLVSFWALAGLLLILKAWGNQLGWGFQMQSPPFVLGLILLFFLLALNLFGLFEFGASLVGLDAQTSRRFHGLTSSFLNGALATLAATPCTAPFMGSSVGFAAQQPAYVAMLIFTFLALGMASPYLLLTIFPAALKFVPKPGAWMETFKQFMGFLLLASVVWLVDVFGALVGADRVSWLLFALVLVAIAAWIYGRSISFDSSLRERILPFVFLLIFLGSGLTLGLSLALEPVGPKPTGADVADAQGYRPWSTAAVEDELAQGHPVFVDFTASWCLSCKVNEKVALGREEVRQAFAEKKVVLFKADWTQADPLISAELQKYHRDGVPLYLLYSPKTKQPEVLPEVLTPGIVVEALNRL